MVVMLCRCLERKLQVPIEMVVIYGLTSLHTLTIQNHVKPLLLKFFETYRRACCSEIERSRPWWT